jgi:hypothetical protein
MGPKKETFKVCVVRYAAIFTSDQLIEPGFMASHPINDDPLCPLCNMMFANANGEEAS